MSRLLFAAAREARIECQSQRYDTASSSWVPSGVWTGVQNLNRKYRDYRIHSDDEALQYGPISTALLEFAETGKQLTPHMVWGAVQDEVGYDFSGYSDSLHRSLFLLILAEALADEGL